MWVKNVGNTGIFVFSSLGVLLHLGRGLCEDLGFVEGLGNDRFATDKYAGKTIFFSTCLLQISTQETRIFFFPILEVLLRLGGWAQECVGDSGSVEGLRSTGVHMRGRVRI